MCGLWIPHGFCQLHPTLDSANTSHRHHLFQEAGADDSPPVYLLVFFTDPTLAFNSQLFLLDYKSPSRGDNVLFTVTTSRDSIVYGPQCKLNIVILLLKLEMKKNDTR